MHKIDVVIVGASLAGSMTAHWLERAGLSCVLVDKSPFPREKACGEGLSVLGLEEVRKLGLESQLLSQPHKPFFGFRFHEGKRSKELSIFNNEDERFHGIGISRYTLDSLLINSLKNSSLERGEVSNVQQIGNGKFIVSTEAQTYLSKSLVVACGAHSKLPQLLGVPAIESRDHRSGLCVKVKTKQAAQRFVDVLIDRNFEACWTWTDHHSATLSFMAKTKNARVLRTSMLNELVERFAESVGVDVEIDGETLGVSGIGRFKRPYFFRNMYLVGDAAKQFDPIGGMGMSSALTGARLTAHSIKQNLLNEVESRALDHTRNMNNALRMMQLYTQLAYFSIVSPFGKKILGPLRTGAIARSIMRTMHDKNEKDLPFSPSLYQAKNL